ncbi:MAG: transposase, partial [Acetobacteraceae bacterium]
LALQVQQALGRDPHAGDLYVFRGRRGDLIKIVWHDGIGMSLYAKRLEKGRFLWPSEVVPGFGSPAVCVESGIVRASAVCNGAADVASLRDARPPSAPWLPR